MNAQLPVRIVMIEDDEGHARLIEKNIRRAGINNEIRHFTDGGSGLDFLFNHHDGPALNGPALVLLDLNLPDMSGTDILAKIKGDEKMHRIPVVVLTTTDDKVEIERCYDLGCNVYITKPVNYESFADAIRQIRPVPVGDAGAGRRGLMKQPRRILYIDDDAGLRRLVEKMLGRRGHTVVTAGDGATGVELARSGNFEIIAVDHYMPGLDGLQTLADLHKLPDCPPVVYVTGSEESSVAVAALKAGAFEYVVKTAGDDFVDLLEQAFTLALARVRLEGEKAAVEEELRSANDRLETLLKEVNHRVANSLQLVSTFIHMQSRGLEKAAREALSDTQRRIDAIAQVHRKLYSSGDVESIEMDEYLAAIVEELEETWSTPAAPRSIKLDAEPLSLHPDKAVSLGIIVNELVSNACKYAYGSECAGEVRVRLTRPDDRRFSLCVEDDGVGMAQGEAPKGSGVGSRLVLAMAKSLAADFHIDPAHGGVSARIVAAI